MSTPTARERAEAIWDMIPDHEEADLKFILKHIIAAEQAATESMQISLGTRMKMLDELTAFVRALGYTGPVTEVAAKDWLAKREQAAREDERRKFEIAEKVRWEMYEAEKQAAFRRGAEWMREDIARLFESHQSPSIAAGIRQLWPLSPPQPAGAEETNAV